VVTITVQPVNDAPTANDDAVTTEQATAVTIPVLFNDNDIEGDALAVTSTTPASSGDVTINPDGTVTYTPNTGFFGIDSFSYTIDDGHGSTATASVTITVIQVISSCDLYPIALHADTLAGAQPGDILTDILNGEQAGNFGWLTWTGSNSTPNLIASLTPPGNSDTYINPHNSSDHTVSVGDWVEGKPGVSNAKGVRDALDVLTMMDIVVPVWDVTQGNGAHAEYHITAFATVHILGYHLPGQDKLSAQFLGYTPCSQ
jgi:hypothetical protein